MAHQVNTHITPYMAQRVALSSSKPIKEVCAALDAEVNRAGGGPSVFKLLAGVQSRKDLEDGMQQISEGRDFVYFLSGSHSRWLNAYFDKTRTIPDDAFYIIGNPLFAATMLEHDMAAGLHVPPKILVRKVEGGTEISYDQLVPAIGFKNESNGELVKAAQEVDRKLEIMLKKVLE